MSIDYKKNLINIVVIVASLGYFVDLYALIIFGIVKDASLISLGITDKIELFNVGNYILRMQMYGMLLGGIVLGILGDKKGRLSTLFFTIILYSLANIANGFVTNIDQYAILRFIAGFGLAGELGVGITLISEEMSANARGKGAGIVSGVGILGAVLGFVVAEALHWRAAYWFGGGAGLLLLILRLMVKESEMYKNAEKVGVKRGNFLGLFTNRKRFFKYLYVVLIGVPSWYIISVLAINSSSFAENALNIQGEVKSSVSVMVFYLTASFGSIFFSYLSDKVKSRKKVLNLILVIALVFTATYFFVFNSTAFIFYSIIAVLGFLMGGLWTIFVSTSSELYGTNLRSTVTTSTPNIVRGAVVVITLSLDYFTPKVGLWWSGFGLGIVIYILALIAIYKIEETYGKELDYIES